MYRLIWMMDDAACKSVWTASKRPLERRELDAGTNYFDILANIYNTGIDQEGNGLSFQNLSVKYDLNEDTMLYEKANTVAEPTNRWLGTPQPVSFDYIYKRTGDLDPNEFVQRNGQWIKENAQTIRTFLYKYYGVHEECPKTNSHSKTNIPSHSSRQITNRC
jgi:hypothetical protein